MKLIKLTLATIFLMIGTTQIFAGVWQGTWQTDYGQLRLYEVGEYVIGDYGDRGLILAKKEFDLIHGVYTNTENKSSGYITFRNNNSGGFDGHWRVEGGDVVDWNGSRIREDRPQLKNFSRDGKAYTPIKNDRGIVNGVWNSNFGELKLVTQDLFLMGDYADKGVFIGFWEGTKYVGHFTNGSSVGWFEFAFLSKNGDFREGKWGFYGNSQSGDWTMNRVQSSNPTLSNIVNKNNSNKINGGNGNSKKPLDTSSAGTFTGAKSNKKRTGRITLENIKIINPEEFNDEPYLVTFTVRAKVGREQPEVYLNTASGPGTIVAGDNWGSSGVTQPIPTKVGQMQFDSLRDYEVYGIYTLVLEEDNTSPTDRGKFIRAAKERLADTFKKEFYRPSELSGTHQQKMDITLQALSKVSEVISMWRLFEQYSKAGTNDDDYIDERGIFSMVVPPDQKMPTNIRGESSGDLLFIVYKNSGFYMNKSGNGSHYDIKYRHEEFEQ